MAPTLKVRKDNIGPYVRHGDRKVRPNPNAEYAHMRAKNIRDTYLELYDKTVAVDHVTKFRPGDHVKKYHKPTTTMFTICSMDWLYREIWFLADEQERSV